MSVILFIILIISVVANVFLYRALSIHIKKVIFYEDTVKNYEVWVNNVTNAVRNTYIRMKRIDDKDQFSKDDEVGVVFKELLNLLKHLNDRIN